MDLEMLELVRRGMPVAVDIVDVFKHPLTNRGQKLAARRLCSFSYQLDIAIGQILDPPGNGVRASNLDGCLSEANTLHLAAEYDVQLGRLIRHVTIPEKQCEGKSKHSS